MEDNIEQLIIVLFGIIAIIYCFAIYYSRLHAIIKASALCILLLFAYQYDRYVHSLLGAPIDGFPANKVVYVHHEIRGTTNRQIYLWVFDVDKQTDRLYYFPYSRETAKQLAGIKQQMQDGKTAASYRNLIFRENKLEVVDPEQILLQQQKG